MEIVRLKNGTEESAILVATTSLALERALETEPIAFIELVYLCRDRPHELWGDTALRLAALGLVDSDGHVQRTTRWLTTSPRAASFPTRQSSR